jgi:release factor glutamine methyltransferase
VSGASRTQDRSPSLADRLAAARASLISAGIAPAEAAVDVDVFARAILGWDRARLLADQRSAGLQGLEPRFSEWVARRAAGEPTAYIVGVKEFWGREFEVTPAVLIPRPETELVVEESARLMRSAARDGAAGPRLADIGTGSGCVAVALAAELRAARVVASDVSQEALEVARRNARRHWVEGRIAFVRTRYLTGIAGQFDLVAANPPYVRESDRDALAPWVRREPPGALFGGADGLAEIAGVIDSAAVRLRPGGWLVLEFGAGQEAGVRALVAARTGLRLDRVRADLHGLPRAAIIQRS